MSDNLRQALNNWYNYRGFSMAKNREEQELARLEQKRLSDIVLEIIERETEELEIARCDFMVDARDEDNIQAEIIKNGR